MLLYFIRSLILLENEGLKMCLLCVELTKNKLTSEEARRNLGEMHVDIDKKHILELLKKIWELEDKEKEDVS